MNTEEFKHQIDLIAALAFIRGYAKAAIEVGTEKREKERLQTIIAKADEGLAHLWPKPEPSADETVQADYRKQTGETGRSVPQYSDPAL